MVERRRRDVGPDDVAKFLQVARDQCPRPADAPIGDDDLARAARDDRSERSCGTAAGAHEQHACAVQIGPGIALDVAHEPGTVGVVAERAFGVFGGYSLRRRQSWRRPPFAGPP